jgi:hypothetical protein
MQYSLNFAWRESKRQVDDIKSPGDFYKQLCCLLFSDCISFENVAEAPSNATALNENNKVSFLCLAGVKML